MSKPGFLPYKDLDLELTKMTETLKRQNPQFAQAVQLFGSANEWYRASMNLLYNEGTFGASSANATIAKPR